MARGETHLAHPVLWDGNHPTCIQACSNRRESGAHAFWVPRAHQRQRTSFPERQAFLHARCSRPGLLPRYLPLAFAEFIRQDILTSKAMGLNMLRCHIKVPDPHYLEAATDRHAGMIWIPVWNDATIGQRKRPSEVWIRFTPRWSETGTIPPSSFRASWTGSGGWTRPRQTSGRGCSILFAISSS